MAIGDQKLSGDFHVDFISITARLCGEPRSFESAIRVSFTHMSPFRNSPYPMVHNLSDDASSPNADRLNIYALSQPILATVSKCH